jgi:hypothetical protein
MSIDDKMTIDERRRCLGKMQERDVRADSKERGQLLDEMEAVTGLDCNSPIRLLDGGLVRQPRCRQRDRTYLREVDDAWRVIAESTDYICAERLTPNLPWLAQHLAAHGVLTVSSRLLGQLACISVSTVARILSRLRQDEPRLPRSVCQSSVCRPQLEPLLLSERQVMCVVGLGVPKPIPVLAENPRRSEMRVIISPQAGSGVSCSPAQQCSYRHQRPTISGYHTILLGRLNLHRTTPSRFRLWRIAGAREEQRRLQQRVTHHVDF